MIPQVRMMVMVMINPRLKKLLQCMFLFLLGLREIFFEEFVTKLKFLRKF